MVSLREAIDPAERLVHNSRMRNSAQIWLGFVLVCTVLSETWASPILPPGDMQLRSDLQLLNDTGVTNIPLTAWPIAIGDFHVALADADVRSLSGPARSAYERVRDRLRFEMDTSTITGRFGFSGASNPRIIRTFENTPREEGEARVELSWLGERFTLNLSAAERWWGPGRDGSLILSTNARPSPGIAIQRNNSTAFKTKWLSWMGPWTFTSFMNVLDDERVVNDAWLFGMRGSFRPTRGLEIGISRAAQWCGDDRPCDLETFFRLLRGRDNRGANVDAEDEPGNQLGGFDIRWTLPRQIPVALYMQWIAEDTRKTGAQLHQWLRQVGVEYWGSIGDA